MKIIKNLYITIIFCIFSAQTLSGNPNIILFGLPGAGKGTLSQKLIEKYQCVHICPGNLLRAEVRNQTNFGKTIEPILAKGDYVPEQDTFAFLKNKVLEAHNKNLPIIFDGYPRSVKALKLLDSLLGDLAIKKSFVVLHLKIEKEKLLERVLKRAVCNKCNKVSTQEQTHCGACLTALEKRPQDTAEILEKRINHYMQIEKPLLQSLRNYGYQMLEIEADRDSEEIFKHVCKLIENPPSEEHPKPRISKRNVISDEDADLKFISSRTQHNPTEKSAQKVDTQTV